MTQLRFCRFFSSYVSPSPKQTAHFSVGLSDLLPARFQNKHQNNVSALKLNICQSFFLSKFVCIEFLEQKRNGTGLLRMHFNADPLLPAAMWVTLTTECATKRDTSWVPCDLLLWAMLVNHNPPKIMLAELNCANSISSPVQRLTGVLQSDTWVLLLQNSLDGSIW